MAKPQHAATPAGIAGWIHKHLSTAYAQSLLEQVGVVFGGAFVAAYSATGMSFSKAALTAACAAGLRAIYAWVAKRLSGNPQATSFKP